MRTVTTCSELWCALIALAGVSRLSLNPRRGFDWRRIARHRLRPISVIPSHEGFGRGPLRDAASDESEIGDPRSVPLALDFRLPSQESHSSRDSTKFAPRMQTDAEGGYPASLSGIPRRAATRRIQGIIGDQRGGSDLA